MSDRVISVEVTLRAPFLFTGLNAPAFGVDSGMIRNAAGQIVIPQSLLRGNLRHVLGEMEKVGAKFPDGCSVPELFGAAAKKNASDETSHDHEKFELDQNGGKSGWAPLRGVLEFSDLVATSNNAGKADGKSSDVLTRIAIDDQTGAVKTGALQVIENPFAVGELVTFSGELRVGGEAGLKAVVELLNTACGLLTALGANKSSGFGRVEGIKFAVLATSDSDTTENAVTAPVYSATDFESSDFALGLTFDRPFLVNSAKLGSNVLKSDINPSGAVIKGAMANKLKAHGCYDQYQDILAAITIRHALMLPEGVKPENVENRPRAIAKSVVVSRMGQDTDALFDGFSDDQLEELAEYGFVFAPDWKGEVHSKVAALFGQAPDPDTEIRTRTAINVERGAAAASQLFSEICVVPGDHVWQAVLSHDFEPGSDEHQKFRDMMVVLANGTLDGIGSTRASANLAIHAINQPIRSIKSDGDGYWRVTLQSDAVMHRVSAMAKDNAGTSAWLKQCYHDYWTDLFMLWGDQAGNAGKHVAFAEGGGSFDFYASQRYAGGYLAARYPLLEDRYYPYLLTEAGSVFRLKLEGSGVEDFLAWLVRFGLVPAHDRPEIAADWQRFPFSPSNGFGEVTVDTMGADFYLEELK